MLDGGIAKRGRNGEGEKEKVRRSILFLFSKYSMQIHNEKFFSSKNGKNIDAYYYQ
jgi:hypothetical protein